MNRDSFHGASFTVNLHVDLIVLFLFASIPERKMLGKNQSGRQKKTEYTTRSQTTVLVSWKKIIFLYLQKVFLVP